ncbi:unnamed protein product, partial [marine sediment metagenome]
MLRKLLDAKTPWDEYLVTFANTGLEDERTLEFVDRVSREWNVDIHWLEAVTHHSERKGCTYR